MKRAPLVAIAATFCLAGCTTADDREAASSAPTSAGKSCFWLSEVNGFNNLRDTTPGQDSIIVSVGAGRKYLFQTFGSCTGINWSETLAFDQRGPGQICDGMDVDIIVPNAIGNPRCPVRMIRKLTKDEIEAMRKGALPR